MMPSAVDHHVECRAGRGGTGLHVAALGSNGYRGRGALRRAGRLQIAHTPSLIVLSGLPVGCNPLCTRSSDPTDGDRWCIHLTVPPRPSAIIEDKSDNMVEEIRVVLRTQIQLTEDQARALKELAARQGISMAELIRRAVERIIEESDDRERRRRALALLGKYRDSAPDVASNHDHYLDEIYGDNLR